MPRRTLAVRRRDRPERLSREAPCHSGSVHQPRRSLPSHELEIADLCRCDLPRKQDRLLERIAVGCTVHWATDHQHQRLFSRPVKDHLRSGTIHGGTSEHFAPNGGWRTHYPDQAPVVSAGVIPNGKTFSTPREMKVLLLETYKEEIANNFVEKLLAYALGRKVEPFDRVSLEPIVHKA